MSLRLNHKIQFIKEEKQQDNTGGYEVVEVVELETWAKIEQLKVQKDIEQANAKLPRVFRVTIRERKDFYPEVDNLIKWKGEQFVIISSPQIDETIRSRFLTFDMK